MKYQIGEWVNICNKQYRGFITNVYNDIDCPKYSIRLTFPLDLLNRCITVKETDLYPQSHILLEEDLKVLIDLSLIHNDKLWFSELCSKYRAIQKNKCY